MKRFYIIITEQNITINTQTKSKIRCVFYAHSDARNVQVTKHQLAIISKNTFVIWQ